jgi:hypothetical protein
MAMPLLSESLHNRFELHKKSDALKELHEKHFDKRYLPNEFGGEIGPLYNSGFLQKMFELDDYFLDLQKSSKRT